MTTIKQALLDMIDNSTDEIAITPENKAWVRDFIKDRSNEELELMLKDKSARSMAIWEDIICRRSKEINPALASLISLGVVKPIEEKTGSDRIMTLPSGRKVVLKGIDHDTLAELHHIKSAGVEAMKKAVATGFEASFSPELIRGTELMRNYLAGVDPQVLHDNTRTIMEEAVIDPLLGAAGRFPASAERQRMFGNTALGQLIRRGEIRANLRSRGLSDGMIDKVFTHLQENRIDLYLFDPDSLTWEVTPATTVFDDALESFNKKAKKQSKKIKQ